MIIMTITSSLTAKEYPNQPSSSTIQIGDYDDHEDNNDGEGDDHLLTRCKRISQPTFFLHFLTAEREARSVVEKATTHACNIAKLQNWKLNKKQAQHSTTKHKTQACCNILESEDLHMVGEDPRCEAMFALVHE